VESIERQKLQLSELQISILKLVAESRTSKQIAAELDISNHTVDTYIWSAMQTLGVNSRSEAAKIVVNPPNMNSAQFIYEPERLDDPGQVMPHTTHPAQLVVSQNEVADQRHKRDWRTILQTFKLPPVGGQKHDLSTLSRLAIVGRIAFISALLLAALGAVISGALHLLGR